MSQGDFPIVSQRAFDLMKEDRDGLKDQKDALSDVLRSILIHGLTLELRLEAQSLLALVSTGEEE